MSLRHPISWAEIDSNLDILGLLLISHFRPFRIIIDFIPIYEIGCFLDRINKINRIFLCFNPVNPVNPVNFIL